jgi:SAM-dependent methyltransferase
MDLQNGHNSDRRDRALDSDVGAVRALYESQVDKEWARLAKDIPGQVSFELHCRLLARFLSPGDRVLEIGAGPGRFTIAMARLGARMTVTDLSPTQLAANAERVREAGCEDSVEARFELDVRDLSRFSDGEFDAAVAFGGPLSYVFEAAPVALAELLRVTRPGGHVLASVMSLLGTWKYFLPGVLDDEVTYGTEASDRVLDSGDMRHLVGANHICQLYTSAQLADMIGAAGGSLAAVSASNWASLGDTEALARIAAEPDRWAAFLDREAAACAEPGALDGGTHQLFAATHAT